MVCDPRCIKISVHIDDIHFPLNIVEQHVLIASQDGELL